MNRIRPLLVTFGVALVLATAGSFATAAGPTTVGLGTATSFAVLAGSGITNTGPTTITGDVGTFPTTTMTGFGSVTLNGVNHGGDAVTQGAKNDLVNAYNDAAGKTPVTTVPTELGGTTLVGGSYRAASGTFGLTGDLTLNGQNDATSVFVFQMASTLTTATSSRVVLTNGAQACNVFWQVGSSATLGGSTSFRGNILALTSITLVTGATVDGRVLARNGAVTLDSNTIARSTCAAPVPTTAPTAAPIPTPTVAPTSTPAPTATPTAAPTAPAATPVVTPTPLATAVPSAPPAAVLPISSLPSTSTSNDQLLPILVGLVFLGSGAVVLRSRRHRVSVQSAPRPRSFR